ncbi:hypothetical protein BDZ89DRAFT_1069953 [Hymenopellis radicata]|nr:hypothetical protein BDZ89DRAFT_1069953 [Hymenopellis radicata]
MPELRSWQQIYDRFRRLATQAFRDAHVVIFPPVHSLPPEIMSKIFGLVVGNGRVVLPARRTTAPWNLLTVCQYWRNIALSLPCLWSSFDIQRDRGPTLIRSPPMVHRGARARAIKVEVIKHLSLSGDEPLNFVVEASETTLSQITLVKLIGQSSRWKDVSLIRSGDLYVAFPNFGAGPLEILQSLSIRPLSPIYTGYLPHTEGILQKFANARRIVNSLIPRKP